MAVVGFWKCDEEFPGTIVHAKRDPATGGPIVGGGMPVLFTTKRADFKHGNIVFFSPSVIVIPRPNVRLIVSTSFRVLEPNEGPSPEWMLTTGVTVTF